MNPRQAAKLLGLSRTHLSKLLDAGVIESICDGQDQRIEPAALRAYRKAAERDKADLAARFARHRVVQDNAGKASCSLEGQL